uniref:ubiquitinyl hydrolase 1 n=1 Tax=Loxodonta africana TaxID=9785 RepID=G3TWU4_LOXAF
NLENACFLNAVLQLSSARPLQDSCLQRDFWQEVPGGSQAQELAEGFADVIGALWYPDSCKAMYVPSFSGDSQQDAQEFLKLLMGQLHLEINRPGTGSPSLDGQSSPPPPCGGGALPEEPELSDDEQANFMWKLYLKREDSKTVNHFVGQLKSCLKCWAYGYCSTPSRFFVTCPYPTPRKDFLWGQVSLQNCFSFFTKEEELELENAPVCDRCRQKIQSTKKWTVQRFPQILILHLNSCGSTKKSSVGVDFPMWRPSLGDFASKKAGSPVYKLYALAITGHHYTAPCLCQAGWHVYNDSHVPPVSENQVASSEGYVMFYQLMRSHPNAC